MDNSRTWTKSQITGRVTPRRAASAAMAAIWALLPSARAIHWRRWCGSRRWASSKPALMTAAMSSATEPVSHLPTVLGPGLRFLLSAPGGAMMPAGSRGAGAQS